MTEVPVTWDGDTPEALHLKGKKIGVVEEYNKDTHQVIVKIDEDHKDFISALLIEQIPISMSCRMEEAKPNE